MQKTTLLVTANARMATMLFFAMMMALPMAAYAQSGAGPTAEPAALATDVEVTPSPKATPDSDAPDKEEKWSDPTPPENYVASKAPSKSESPYNYIQMAYGGLVMLVMGGFIYWLIRRNTRDYESSKEV